LRYPSLALALVLLVVESPVPGAISPRAPAAPPGAQRPAAVWPRAPLAQPSLALLPLGSIKPKGWLQRQLQVQATGLTGHLDEIWPDVGPSSGWLGGGGEGWERGPYFLDGLLPLAYLLDDDGLKAKAQKWVEWTLTHQDPDGRIGPPKNTDWWPNMVMLKVLTQYQEATGDPRVIPVLQKYFAYHLAHAKERPLQQWAVYRWADELVSVLWLYNRTGDPSLLELASVLHAQGADWKKHFAAFEFTGKTSEEQLGLKNLSGPLPDRAMRAHGVNNAMALKTSALWSFVSDDQSDRRAIYRALEVLDRHHPMPNGMFTATEHYAGPDPSQGVELCAVVEALFSLQHVIAIAADPILADRVERIAFNALPATFSADMWAHQYNQQTNQVLCTLEKRDWVSNGPESNLFGVEPNFGCCTANMHQGWPKLVQSLWMATPHGGVAATVFAPSEVHTVLQGSARPQSGESGSARLQAGPSGTDPVQAGPDIPVRIIETTDYPFRGEVTFELHPERPARFPFSIRIPAWAEGATVSRNGRPALEVPAGRFHLMDLTWTAGDRVVLHLPMRPRLSTWYRDSLAVERGPLVFSLRIDEDWKPIEGGMKHPATAPAKDWQVLPKSPWNYGLVLADLTTAQTATALKVTEKPIGEYPFSALAAPVEIMVPARRLPAWTLVNGSAGPLPQSPVASSGPDETVTLVPYGSAKLRVTEFPRVAR
jgi:uncharacterized protein